MQYSISFVVIVIVGLIVHCESFPNRQRMVYYHPSSSWYAAPQRLMYLQYQHVHPSKTHARSTQAAAALVAGDSVATGTYFKDCNNPEDTSTLEDDLNETGAHEAQSVAEAYPDQTEFEIPTVDSDGPYSFNQQRPSYDAPVENLIPNSPEQDQQSGSKVPRDYNFEKSSTPKPETVDVPISEDEIPTEISTIAPVRHVKPIRKHMTIPAAPTPSPSKRYLPAKKKVIVELEQENEHEDEEEEEDGEEDDDDEETSLDEYDPLPEERPSRLPNARRPTKPVKPPAAKKPSKGKKPLPAGTFFPIDFGRATGGAIAIANSFSTGEGGSARSHAVAYGSPEAARARLHPTKFH